MIIVYSSSNAIQNERDVLLSGVLDLSSFNENLSAFLYNRKSKIIDQCGVGAATSVAKQFVVILVHEKTFRDLGSGFVYYIVTDTSVYKKRSRTTKMKKLSSKEKIRQDRMLKKNLKKMKKRKDRKEKNEKEKNKKK